MTEKIEKASNCKFRISLTLEQINWILSCPEIPVSLSKQLNMLKLKAENGLVTPAYTLTPRQPAAPRYNKIRGKQAYELGEQFVAEGQPIPEDLMHAYQEYKYLNDLMSPEEQLAYERQEMGSELTENDF